VAALLTKGVRRIERKKIARVRHELFVPRRPRRVRDSSHVKIVDAATVLGASK
jgi:hypothetical protein